MGIKKATIKIFTCTRRQRKDGTYPTKLKVTYNGDSNEYNLNLYVTDQENALLESNRFGRNDKLKGIHTKRIDFQSRANRIIEKMPVFNSTTFGKEFLGSSYSNGDTTYSLIELLNQRSDKSRQEGSISYSDSFKTTANRLKGYRSKVTLSDVNVDFLKDFEKWLLDSGNRSGAVGVYMRNIRTTLNEAIENGSMTKNDYPFGRKKYCIPQQRNNKTALSKEEVRQILSYKAIDGSSEQKALDFWIFMYLTNGLNMKDVALLKVTDLKPELEGLNFIRAKTIKTTKNDKMVIDVCYTEDGKEIIKAILSKHGNGASQTDDYLFPILRKGISATDERRLIQNFTRFVNKNMMKVSKSIGLKSVPKTNTARHSFVTMIVNLGQAPLTDIKDLVGHRSVTTTAGYVKSLPTEKKKDYAKHLL